jgi:hypothetical protein
LATKKPIILTEPTPEMLDTRPDCLPRGESLVVPRERYSKYATLLCGHIRSNLTPAKLPALPADLRDLADSVRLRPYSFCTSIDSIFLLKVLFGLARDSRENYATETEGEDAGPTARAGLAAIFEALVGDGAKRAPRQRSYLEDGLAGRVRVADEHHTWAVAILKMPNEEIFELAKHLLELPIKGKVPEWAKHLQFPVGVEQLQTYAKDLLKKKRSQRTAARTVKGLEVQRKVETLRQEVRDSAASIGVSNPLSRVAWRRAFGGTARTLPGWRAAYRRAKRRLKSGT